MVTHDRYFMDRLVDHLLVFEGEGEIRDFPGNYTQYRLWLKDNEKKDKKWEELAEQKSSGLSVDTIVKDTSVAAGVVKRKMSFKEKREWEQLEQELEKLALDKERITIEMSSGECSFDELQQLSAQLQSIQQTTDSLELRWLELSELNPG